MLNRKDMHKPMARITALIVVFALAAPAAALADDSTVGGYGGVAGVTQSGVASTPSAQAPAQAQAARPVQQVRAASGGNLPFTGMDAVAVLAVGVMLAAAGLTLRRLSEHRAQ
jgi:hypothetical protein